MSQQRPQSVAPYKKLKLLGQGSFGKAYLVERIIDRQTQVLKQLDLSNMNENEKRETYKEAEILKNLHHNNIIQVTDVCKTKSNKLWIVMEYADSGDLEKRLKTQ